MSCEVAEISIVTQPLAKDTCDQTAAKLHLAVCEDKEDYFYGRIRKRCAMFLLFRFTALVSFIEKQKRKTSKLTPADLLLFQYNGYNAQTAKAMTQYFRGNSKYLPENYTFLSLRSAVVHQFEILLRLLGSPSSFLFCIDEAQTWSNCVEKIIYSANGTPREGALLSIFLFVLLDVCTEFSGIKVSVFTCGTAYTMDHAIIRQSGAAKRLNEITLSYLSIPLFNRTPDVIEYLSKHITLPPECVNWMYSPEFARKYLPLRIRMVAIVISQLTESRTNLFPDAISRFKTAWKNAFDYFRDATKRQFLERYKNDMDLRRTITQIIMAFFLNQKSVNVAFDSQFCTNGVLYSGAAYYQLASSNQCFLVNSSERVSIKIFGEALLGNSPANQVRRIFFSTKQKNYYSFDFDKAYPET